MVWEFDVCCLCDPCRRRMVRFWAMGTGIAGVAGAMAYAALTTILSPRNAVITMVIVPVVMLVRLAGDSLFLIVCIWC